MQDTRTPSSTGFRRRCAAWRVTFLCVAKEKSPKERPPPLVRPPTAGSLGSGKRLAERRRRYIPVPPASAPSSMTALLTLCPHLGEQQGATPNPPPRGKLTAPYLFGAMIGRVVISDPALRPPRGEIRLPHLRNRHERHGCTGEKIMVSTTASGTHTYRGVALY